MTPRHVQSLILACSLALGVSAAHAASQADLVAALTKSKLTLTDGIRQATSDGGVAISAKFEFDDEGKLSLSVYSAKKGLSVAAKENVLEEISGSPEQSPWKPKVEVFKDAAHIARSSEQLLVLLCHKRNLAFTRRQHGHRGSVASKAAAIRSRKVVMDDGTWRCVRWAAARLVMRG